MTREGEVHKGIRLRILKIIEERGYKCFSGHGGNQNLSLFSDRKSNETHFSDADILVLNGNDKIISIIEIKDKDVQPKEIIGIISSTSIDLKAISKYKICSENEFEVVFKV